MGLRWECGPRENWSSAYGLISVVGTGLSLPLGVEPYGPGDSEYAAGQRLLRRVIGSAGKRFAQYVVVDGRFATAPFLHTVLHEEQVWERIYEVTCRSCGWQGDACGISATHISETNELCSSGRNRHASVVTR